jgi:hypothetical protein
MWNLTGDDILRVKEEIKGRRAAIQARYENELKQLETAIADIETFERAAVNFVLQHKAEDGPAPTIAAPAPAVETVVAEIASTPTGSTGGEAPVEQSAEAEPAPSPEQGGGGQKSSSRWRMRLSTGEVSP